MRSFYALFLSCFLFACKEPIERVQPFIKITLQNPEGFVAPQANLFVVTNEGVVNGSPVEKTFEVDAPDHLLPTSFVIRFSEGVRGTIVDITIIGEANGEPIFLATASAVADVSEIEMVARFCGDVVVDDDRLEQCDDGPSNSDTVPDACRLSCQLPSCGDAVVDSGEQCDDGVNNSDLLPNACRSLCLFPSCGDGVADNGEACDEGVNNSDLLPDSCRGDCSLPRCGDGVTDSSEECDDANTINNDGCDNDCATSKVVQVATGGHTCVLLRFGDVRCWGPNDVGQLGYGNTNNIGDNEAPRTAGNVDIGGKAIQVTVGFKHTCVLLDTGKVRCWGESLFGKLGIPNVGQNIGDNELPTAVAEINLGGTAIQIDAGANHTCAVLAGGTVRCWGFGLLGRLGYGNSNTIGDNEAPASAGNVNIGGIAVRVEAGSAHTCVLLDNGSVRCWGNAANGELGYGNTNNIGDTETPASAGNVSIANIDTVQLSVGSNHTCARLNSNDVRCWGLGLEGVLGYGNTNNIGDDETPFLGNNVSVGGQISQISAGGHSCALLTTGKIRCWGGSADGQLGYGNTTTIGDNEQPVVAGDVNLGGIATAVQVGGTHTCAILVDGQLKCWGTGLFGRLGYGNEANIGDNETPATIGNVPLF